MRRFPRGVVCERAALVEAVTHSVRLDVGFAIDVYAYFVAQLVKTSGLRVVAGAHGADVVAAHDLQVAAQILLREVVARELVVLVDVHSLELDRLAVYQKYFVRASRLALFGDLRDLETAESHVERYVFGRAAAARVHRKAIEIGPFGRPFLGVGHRAFERGRFSAAHRARTRQNRLARGVLKLVTHLAFAVARGHYLQREQSVAIVVVEGRHHVEVADGRLGLRAEIYVAFDAAYAPEVLTFEIRSRAPAEYLEREAVFALLHIVGYAEARQILRILAVTYLAAVHIDVNARFGARQVEEDILVGPLGSDGEFAAIDAYGIRLGERGRLGIVRLELIGMVYVYGGAVTLKLPVARDLYVVPRRRVLGGIGRRRGHVAVSVVIFEFPRAVQQAVVVRSREVAFGGLFGR